MLRRCAPRNDGIVELTAVLITPLLRIRATACAPQKRPSRILFAKIKSILLSARKIDVYAIGATVEVAKRSELHKFAAIPQRWVVERSFAWLEKCRRLWKNCERKINTSLQMAVLAFLTLLLKRL